MGKIFRIVYTNFLDEETKRLTVGGIQTYILNLSKLIKSLGHDVIIYQRSTKSDFNCCIENDIIVKGKYFKKKKRMYYTVHALSEYCISESDPSDIIIFASEAHSIPTTNYSITIQHGICWDIPTHVNWGSMLNRMYMLFRTRKAYIEIKRLIGSNKVVCVDYNFVNWYRTQIAYQDIDFDVIPNFTEIPEYIQRDTANDEIKIIFARRFFPYRGTRIFAEAIEKLLQKYNNISVLIAGSGPDEEYLKDKFMSNKRVSITSFLTTDSLKIHSEYDIAVVPTIGSEGTSLSLLEAMASGCAAIATNVGGMTNIILSGYNGLLINPTAKDIENAIEKLILNPELRNKLSKNGYETVKEAFSKERWQKQWENIIQNI